MRRNYYECPSGHVWLGGSLNNICYWCGKEGFVVAEEAGHRDEGFMLYEEAKDA